MSTSDPDSEQAYLAAEYVLGALEPEQASMVAERLRFDAVLRDEVAVWEHRLSMLARDLPPHPPRSGVWQTLVDRLGFDNWRQQLWFWRGMTAASMMATLVLAAVLVFAPGTRPGMSPADAPLYVSLIRDETRGVGWLVTAGPDKHELRVKTLGSYQVPGHKSLQLWLHNPSGELVSLGLLPTDGEQRFVLPANLAEALSDRATLAVSLEPPGGSPTGRPTGQTVSIAPVTAETS
ncbi:anti-sigma factor [Spectribacter hydrogenooxidans]|uniref:Anti-sigma factor n=1 Tax=Spectribacter hydrogenoxidans TaxID=3075608 RepID=A0ABU3C0A8_9GAMM|nr:anti-sigma factor [Salinisphaera sp. W335]MDT0634789.1 anti-sigma factor [Salinisphaera sp. W335]